METLSRPSLFPLVRHSLSLSASLWPYPGCSFSLLRNQRIRGCSGREGVRHNLPAGA